MEGGGQRNGESGFCSALECVLACTSYSKYHRAEGESVVGVRGHTGGGGEREGEREQRKCQGRKH